MSEQNKPDSASIQLPGVAIVALILGVFVLQDTAFESSRPARSDAEHSSSEDVRSRLWQDPFEAVTLHRKKFHQFSNEHRHTIVVSKDSGTYAYQLDQSIQRICHSNNPNISAHSIEELRCQIQRDIALNDDERDGDFHVLAVMVPGGPYAENKEWRLRSRYALVSGLAATGYKPEDPEHIGFMDFSQACQKAFKNGKKSDIKFCDWPPFIPYEWFKPEIWSESRESNPNARRKRILVLWLDNGAIAQNKNPLNMLDRLKDGITPGEEDGKLGKERFIKPSFNIIGPHSSTTLAAMYKEIYSRYAPNCNEKVDTKNCEKPDYPNLSDSLIFSASATIDRDDIIERIKEQIKPEGFEKNHLQWLDERIVRPVSTHKKLAGTLACELALRGVKFVNPVKANKKIVNKECPLLKHALNAGATKKKDHIVLIGEWDTVYSRHLTESIKEKIKEYSGQQVSIDEWVHSFNYLRGIDGINAEQVTSAQKDNKEKSDMHGLSREQTGEQLRRPTGSNQFDYLRRLVSHLDVLHKSKVTEGGIKAIGILGNDPYDKLLILQALHKRFPQVLFFTTDLDARFLHPSELKWTRNLIVASSYGFELHEKIQGGVMPFRDSYQTALYLATKLAINCQLRKSPDRSDDATASAHCEDADDLSLQNIFDHVVQETYPRLFEIGNYAAIDLSHAPKKEDEKKDGEKEDINIHPVTMDLSKDGKTDTMWLIAAFVLIMLLLCLLVPVTARPVIVVISAATACIMLLYAFFQSQDNYALQTFSFTNGISTWPANAIRFFALIIAIVLLVSIKRQLIQSSQKIREQFIPFSLQDNDEQFAERPDNGNRLSLFLVEMWGREDKKGDNETPVHFIDLWNRYRKALRCSVSRVVTMLVLYLGCIVLLIQTDYFEMPGIPARGQGNYDATRVILMAVVLLYLTLIFTIADIAHLSSHFIMLLKTKAVIWPQEILNVYIKKYGASENNNLAKNKLLMDMVNRLAGDVNSFIYYPFVILFLLILSRSHYFDNWHYTPLLFMLISFTAIIALCSAIKLRKAAIDTRNHFLEKLDICYWESIKHEAEQKNEQTQAGIKLLTEEIKNLNTGPYQPIGRHPIVLSLLMPLGSVGGLYLIEYFLAAG
ncbi:MAG TPA: hypothetical protein DEF07_05830 [Nitrosomonas sp.]|nr:hypothetical protein [Nitrosomonas sp.]